MTSLSGVTKFSPILSPFMVTLSHDFIGYLWVMLSRLKSPPCSCATSSHDPSHDLLVIKSCPKVGLNVYILPCRVVGPPSFSLLGLPLLPLHCPPYFTLYISISLSLYLYLSQSSPC